MNSMKKIQFLVPEYVHRIYLVEIDCLKCKYLIDSVTITVFVRACSDCLFSETCKYYDLQVSCWIIKELFINLQLLKISTKTGKNS